MKKILFTGGSIVRESGVEKADVLIDTTGVIEKIVPKIQDHKETEIVDAKGLLLFPLLIDCHVHFREPGLEHKATMETEALAALSGGVGTVCEMPNTIPPTVTVAALADKVRRAAHVDGFVLKFFFGVTEPLHLAALRDLWNGSSMELKRLKHHCAGVKIYLDHSTGNQKIDADMIDDVFKVCAELKIPLVAHCEDSSINEEAKKTAKTHSEARPPASEEKSIAEAIERVRKTNAAFHVAHLSTKQGLDLVRKAKEEKLPVTCEVAPHHLFLSTDDEARLGTLGKMNPPLRPKEHAEALWKGIKDGTVDCIATDHAPHTLEEKNAGDWKSAPSGVPGVETMLPLLLNEAFEKNPRLSYENIVRLCFTNPNNMYALRQPSIEVGAKARISLVDPTEAWTVLRQNLKTKCGWSPYEGKTIRGKIKKIFP